MFCLFVLAVVTAVFLPETAAADDLALVLQSEDLLAYSEPVEGFRESLQDKASIQVDVRNIRGDLDRARTILEEYGKQQPTVIYALGAQAAYVAKQIVPEVLGKKIPFVFSSVLDWESYGFNTPYSTGIKAKVPVRSVLVQSSMVIPEMEKIAVLYSTETADRIREAKSVAEELDLSVEAVEVNNPEDVEQEIAELEELNADAWWLPADPAVVTVDNFKRLRQRAVELGQPLIVYSESFVRAGGLVSVSIDYRTVGSQAASIVLEVLDGQPIDEIEVADPIGTEFLGNSAVAAALGIDITNTARFMDRLYDEVEGDQ